MGAVGVQTSEILALHSGMATSGYATAIAVEAGTGNITGGLWDALTPLEVVRVGLLVTVLLDYATQTAEGVVTFYKRVTYGSDTGRVEIGAVRLIDGTAAGDILYADVANVKCLPGEQIIAAVSTAGTGGGGIAGDFQPVVYAVPVPESDYVATNFVNAKPAA